MAGWQPGEAKGAGLGGVAVKGAGEGERDLQIFWVVAWREQSTSSNGGVST
ncbi:hypothetical protein MAPG_08042 [Magnaporthiopsis poae ATCC 64411]|uniref:Uncharacterized protein n=1 Tax=Magnaporthiopsis poae (strain ATCC 64411 / 73-15) TaxID=644358 RepID=A0A0C4E6B1_MAGP6|nr:hypothetical protein MAPG_08042 [Magnaporthiopsis poae ATCC 64411]